MLKPLCFVALLLAAALARADGGALTEAETRWIGAGMPVVRHAVAARLPVDIVVQPGDEPDASPIALGIKDGRCKLVLSLRGNPSADALDRSVPSALFASVAEAVFAHEIGHCWRYVEGAWKVLPGDLTMTPEDAATTASIADDAPGGAAFAAQAARRREMREAQCEEGYADLVGLAWTRRAHPAQYAAVLAWLEHFRDDDLPGAYHDTTTWLRLAADPTVFDAADDVFRSAQALWERGLRAEAHQRSNGGGPSVSMR